MSRERLGPYVSASGGDLARGVQLYRWNASVSAAFWEVLGHGEVILRNVIHDQLTAEHHRRGDPGEWFDDPRHLLTARALEDIRSARTRAGGAGAPAGKVVAELPFGFWRYLLARRYISTLWPVIRRGFPHLSRARAHKTLEQNVIDLHQLRNRLAHHEPLIATPIEARRASLRAVLDAIDPQMSAWALDDGGRLTALIQNRP